MPFTAPRFARVVIHVSGEMDRPPIMGELSRVPVEGEIVVVDGRNLEVRDVFHQLDAGPDGADAVLTALAVGGPQERSRL